MRAVSKITSLLLVLLLLAIMVSSLVACNKENEDVDKRAEYCSALESTVVTSMDEKWTANMTNDEVASLDNAGEYIVTSGWVSSIKDVVYDSSLQTEKINTILEFLSSEQGKVLLSDFNNNAGLLLTLLKQAGLTSEDISNLLYDFVYCVVDESGVMLQNMADRMVAARSNGATKKAKDNIELYISNINKSISNFVPTQSEKNAMLEALREAKGGISSIVDFAFGISIDSLSENIIALINSKDGALSNITNEEIITIISAITRNTSDLKANLTESVISKINTALSLVINKFDSTYSSSMVFSQIVSYSKYAYMIVDAIPDICDVLSAVTNSIDADLITVVKDYIMYAVNNDMNDDSAIFIANTSVLIANVFSRVTNQLGEEKLYSIINNLYTKTNVGDHQKAFPILVADLAVNASTILNNSDGEEVVVAHPTIISKEAIMEIMNATFGLNISLNKFKKAYYNDYLNGDSTFATARNMESALSSYVNNPHSFDLDKVSWYTTYVEGAKSKLNEFAANNIESAKNDLIKFVEEYYLEGSTVKSSTETLCTYSILPMDASEELIHTYLTKIQDAKLYYYALGIMVLKTINN